MLAPCLPFAQVNNSAQKQIIGVWKYDLNSLKVEVPASGKAASKTQNGKQIQAELKKALATTALTFKPGRRLIVTETNPPATAVGTWNLKGRTITVVMTNARSQTPRLELSKDGKHIFSTLTIQGAGTARISLRRVR
jgi:hypothetical protein